MRENDSDFTFVFQLNKSSYLLKIKLQFLLKKKFYALSPSLSVIHKTRNKGNNSAQCLHHNLLEKTVTSNRTYNIKHVSFIFK